MLFYTVSTGNTGKIIEFNKIVYFKNKKWSYIIKNIKYTFI